MGHRIQVINQHGQWNPSTFVFVTRDEAFRFGLSLTKYLDSFCVEECDEQALYYFAAGAGPLGRLSDLAWVD